MTFAMQKFKDHPLFFTSASLLILVFTNPSDVVWVNFVRGFFIISLGLIGIMYP